MIGRKIGWQKGIVQAYFPPLSRKITTPRSPRLCINLLNLYMTKNATIILLVDKKKKNINTTMHRGRKINFPHQSSFLYLSNQHEGSQQFKQS